MICSVGLFRMSFSILPTDLMLQLMHLVNLMNTIWPWIHVVLYPASCGRNIGGSFTSAWPPKNRSSRLFLPQEYSRPANHSILREVEQARCLGSCLAE